MNKKILFLLLPIVVILSGCSNNTFDSQTELLAFIQDESNGFLQEKTVNGITFQLLYRPTDLLVHQELTNQDKSSIPALKNRYNQYLYFNLSMSRGTKELLSALPKNKNEFGQMVNDLAFGMDQKVNLFTKKKDTIEMVDFIYPRMYGMSNATTIMLVYPRNKEKLQGDYLHLTIEDFGTNTGEVKFKIPTDILKHEPKLSFKQ
ncbi:hypothetical protein KORDIASMS9_01411 [Kordia sp. SMS9]|uniref:hypothetical protein n=1 Tax=Kordia sp. SMS9 TaxID=2282170 RepID=UPI000E0D4228|nr:hypothetical protein [Kordia sp. SMS9]AXG69191.1 hypothetical protein KORDIASMS9_01411 [Kordia sp. SMS9]